MRDGSRWSRLVTHRAVRTFGPFLPLLLAWWVVAETELFPPAFFVGPVTVLAEFGDLIKKGILPAYLSDSLTRLASGVLFGLLIGVPAGFLVALSRRVRKLVWPLLLFFQAVADIAWLPIVIVWFGFSLTAVTVVIVYTVVFPLVISIVAGVEQLPRDLPRAARSLGAGRFGVFLDVVLPGALPALATGVRTGLGYGWRALIAAEIIVGTSGIGFMMFDARRGAEVTGVFVGMITLGVLWFALDALILAPFERGTVQRWGMVRTAEVGR
ncbi:ABC transporter permease [Amycolatopsis cihanbeyliensis]|uniref:NitT/TauT family transport system permease protein/taurine transport system permease protein n=1 Tax=Amycolatopsis cihanbeyliensis TaxID=1128664 RepID=A0A542DFU8_AMYCI|nr:ABC transporter permease [Amycolatopsis cihanbeyliensis]TQJ01957.1 NitT/TauT family transport system permease protein/taurine transport system permease protein [Amycolatopsis cihanbeyliensis]